MKIICSKCEKENPHSPEVAGLVKCVYCAEWFQAPREETNISPPTTTPPESKKISAESALALLAQEAEVALRLRQETLRAWADNLAGLGRLLFIIGAISFFISIIITINDSPAMVVLMIASGCMASGFWIYLIAQLVHIRANTEK